MNEDRDIASKFILVVDDEPTVCSVVIKMLEVTPHEIDFAGDGQEALKKYSSQDCDLMIVDLKMPKLDGNSLIEEIRKKDEDIAFIVLTGHSDFSEAYSMLNQYHISDFLHKPLENQDRLLFAVEKAFEEQELKQQLKTSEKRLRVILDSAHDAIISADQEGNITTWNKGAEEIFGYKEKEVLGEQLTLLMPEEYRERHRNGIEQMTRTGNSHVLDQKLELHGLNKRGKVFPIELTLSTWKEPGERFFSAIIRDISERKSYKNKE